MRSAKPQKALAVTWNFSPLFGSDTDPQIAEDLKQTEAAVMAFVHRWQDRQDYLENPDVLVEALNEYDLLQKEFGTAGGAGYYFGLRGTQEENNPLIKAKINQIEELSRKLGNQLQFFELRLSKLTPEQQQKLLRSPKLLVFKHYLERLFATGKYLLSEAEEKIMNLKSSSSHALWVRMTTSFLAKEIRHSKNIPQLISDLSSTKKPLRDKSATDLHGILVANVDVAENELNAILGNKKIDDELRGMTRPDESRHVSDDIDSKVVDAMISAVTARFDISERYYYLKAKILGVSKLKYWERNVPYGKISKKYSYTDSVKLVTRVFSQLDADFVRIFKGFVANGQLDVYPRQGKRGGAFCADDLITHPTYILLNHTDCLNDVLTLAHEMGHGINNELMKSQRALNFGSPLSMAEVASTFMEDFVLQELLAKSSETNKLALYIQKLDDEMSSIFRQVAAYNFEKELHLQFSEQGYLPKEKIGEIFKKHMQAYMGKYVEQSEGAENYWVYWSHFRSFFYVYSYASGLLISKSLQAKVKQDPEFVVAVKKILAAGSSDAPQNIFKKHADIDISDPEFWTTGLNEVELLLTQAEKLWEEVK